MQRESTQTNRDDVPIRDYWGLLGLVGDIGCLCRSNWNRSHQLPLKLVSLIWSGIVPSSLVQPYTVGNIPDRIQ